MFKLYVSKKAEKRLKLLKRTHQKAIVSALQEIQEDPYCGKPLSRDLTGRFTYKVGVYRIIYHINEQNQTIRVLNAGHRGSVYNK